MKTGAFALRDDEVSIKFRYFLVIFYIFDMKNWGTGFLM